MSSRWFIAAAATSLLFWSAPALAAFEVPPNDGYVTDVAGVLSGQEQDTIEARLRDEAQQTSNEIAVVIIPSLDGEPIEAAALEIGRRWGVGSTKDNGILLLVAYEDREVRIEVGYGLEGAVPDIVAKGIIDTDIVPAFRDGRYADGIEAALTSLQRHIAGEYTADRYAVSSEGSGSFPFILLFAFFLVQWLLSVLARTKSWWLGGVWGAIAGIVLAAFYGWWLSIPFLTVLGLILDYVVSHAYQKRGKTAWWAGGRWGPGGGSDGFGGRGSGGGFGGFGGGSFGGGGASGRW